MIIRAEDMKMLAETLEKQLPIGNRWATYENGLFHSQLNDMRFFKMEEEAQQHCIKINDIGLLDYSWISIEPLYKVIQQKLVEDISRTDVEFYYVNDLRFEVSRTLKSDSDPIYLYDPDKDEFSATIHSEYDRKLSHLGNRTELNENLDLPGEKSSENKAIDKQSIIPSTNQTDSYEHLPLPYENINQLREKILALTFNEGFASSMISKVREGVREFEKTYYEVLGDEKIAIFLHCSRDDKGLYDLDKIKATYYHPIKVEPLVINGIDIMKLEAVMMSRDWRFEKLRIGKEVEDSLRLISQDDDGKRIAVALWNNIVPPMSIEKPDFIERGEKVLGMYISRNFSGDKNFAQIYAHLKVRQIIDETLLNLPINSPMAKLAITEHLATGESLSLQLPTGPMNSTELSFQWDLTSKGIKVLDQEGNTYHVGKDKVWSKSENQDLRKIKSQQDVVLLQKHRIKSDKGLTP